MNKNRLVQLNTRIKRCKLCTELVKTRNQIVPGYGDFNASILIIGEAPGRLGADVTGIPFTKDRSGVFLQKMLCKIKLNEGDPESLKPRLKDVYITNVIRCNPQTSTGLNRKPSLDEIENCKDFLKKEIDIIKPQLVVSLGLLSSRIILNDGFDGRDFGKIFKKEAFSVLPLWHPSFIMRGGGKQKINEKYYFKYFKKIKSFTKSK